MAYSTVYGLDIIRFLAEQPAPVAMKDIVESTGIARATTYRAVEELTRAGYVQASGNPKKFRPTWKVAQLGLLMLSHNRTREVALSNILGLSAASGQLAFVSFLEGNETVFTDSAEVIGERISIHSTGTRLPTLTTASGRAILSHCAPAHVEALIEMGIPRATPLTKTNRDEMLLELECSRDRGFGLSDNEAISGTVSIASAVWDGPGEPSAAVGLSIHNQAGPEVVQRYGDMVRGWARKASTELGHRPLTPIA